MYVECFWTAGAWGQQPTRKTFTVVSADQANKSHAPQLPVGLIITTTDF